MRKIKLHYMLLLVVAFTGCEDNLLPKTDNSYGDKDQWRLPEKAEGVLMNAYANIDGQIDGYGNNFLDAATDNAVTNDFGSEVYNLGSGAFSTSSYPLNVWGLAYTQFRNIHLFLENGLGDNVTYILTDHETDSLYKMRLKGEAFFLRAWWGFKLLQHYGGKTSDGQALGYPIITHTLDGEAVDPEQFQRNTYQECLAQIGLDCDSAAYYLPDIYKGNDPVTGETQLGRASRLAALALKSRAYTYGASPAYQTDDVTVINGMGSFSVVNSGAYTAQWVRAAEVSNEAILEIGNFQRLNTNDFNAGATPDEFIWRAYHNNRSLEERNYPPMFYGSGLTSPSHNLVEAFPMKNGFPVDDARSGYDPGDPYAGRDPRLDLTVLHHGSTLGGEPVEIIVGSKDARGSHPKATRTGYYLRKWLSGTADMLNPENPQDDHHYNVLLRKTEVYLNFAEASNEAWGPAGIGPGFTRSAMDVIKSIRNEAGITGDTYTDEVAAQGKDAFRSLIQNERRITLAFENHWYFDTRRWLLPLNNPVMGVQVTSDENGVLNLNEFEVEKRNLNDARYYYLPLPYDEAVKSHLKNNLGWN